MLAAAARRFLVLLAGVALSTAGVSLLLGLAAGSSPGRALSLGFYLVGSFLLVAGFFLGNRGPVRPKGKAVLPLIGPRLMRWATPEERDETINESAVFVVLGFALLVLGVLADSRYRLI